MATNLTEDTAADNNYSGDAFRAGSVSDPGEGADLSSNPMTDYRGVDEGLTSVGATDQNSDMSSLGALGVAGVRIGDDVPGSQSGGVVDEKEDEQDLLKKGNDTLTGDDRDDKTDGIVLNDPAAQRHAP